MSFYKTDFKHNIKKTIQVAETKKEQALFVFDIDSTLLCMKYRTQAIIKDCTKDPLFITKFSKHIPIIQKISVTERDWSIHEILSRYGFSKHDPITVSIENFWRKKFFSNEYLHFDQPYKSSQDFLQYISQLDVQLYYLTARAYQKMHTGTLLSLKKWSFPLKHEKRLIMKEDFEIKLSDVEYKVKHLKKLSTKSDTILFFENEPLILNAVASSLPLIQLFWIDSTHSRQAQPSKKALTLNMDYSFSKSK